VDLSLHPRHALGYSDAFLLSLVSEHRSSDQVADGINAGHAGLESIANDNLPGALIQFHAGFLQPQSARAWPAAYRDQHLVSLEQQLAASRLCVHDDLATLRRGARNFRVQLN